MRPFSARCFSHSKSGLVVGFVGLSLLSWSCGGGGSSGSQTTTLTGGNWYLRSTSSVLLDPNQLELRGSLTQSGTTISGVLRSYYPLNCYGDSFSLFPVSGNVSGNSAVLTMTSSGQTITINGPLSSAAAIEGSYAVTGGCADGWQGNLSGVFVPSLSGNWSGTFSSGSVNHVASLVVTQGVFLDATGYFLLTGTVNFSGSPCFTSGSLAGSWVSGKLVILLIATDDGGIIAYEGELTDPSTATRIGPGLDYSGNYTITGGHCDGESGSSTLTKS